MNNPLSGTDPSGYQSSIQGAWEYLKSQNPAVEEALREAADRVPSPVDSSKTPLGEVVEKAGQIGEKIANGDSVSADDLTDLGEAAAKAVEQRLLKEAVDTVTGDNGKDELVAFDGEASEIGTKDDDNAPEGIVYRRTDDNGSPDYYGQAKSDERYGKRQQEVARQHPDADFEFEIVDRAEPGVDLDVAEHHKIQEATGGVRAKDSDKVANKKDPVGPRRRPGLNLPEPRREPQED